MSVELLSLDAVTQRIVVLRKQKVLLDADLATLYGVETRRLNEQVRRNLRKFPADFIFEVTRDEAASLKSHFATSSWGGRRKAPLAFTEHGAIMAATVLKSPRAVEISVYVVRAFIRLRELVASNKDLSLRLDELETRTDMMMLKHDMLERDTQGQLKQIIKALRELTAPQEAPAKRPIGFVTPDDPPAKSKSAKSIR